MRWQRPVLLAAVALSSSFWFAGRSIESTASTSPCERAGARARARASRGFSPIRRDALPVLEFDMRDAPRPGPEHAALVAKLRAALSPGNDASATTAAVDAMIPGGDALSPWLAAFEDAVSNASCHRAAAFASRPSACLFVTSKARRATGYADWHLLAATAMARASRAL